MAEMLPNTTTTFTPRNQPTALGQSVGQSLMPVQPPPLPPPPPVVAHPLGDVPPKIHTPLNPASALHHQHPPPPPTAAAAVTNRQLMKGDRHLFSTSDESAMRRQIMAYHAPDGRDFDVKPLLLIIEDIMHRAKPTAFFTPVCYF